MPSSYTSNRGHLLLQLGFFLSLMCTSMGTTVYLSIDNNTISDLALPEDLYVKIHLDGRYEQLASLHMKPIHHFDDRVPAYTVRLDGSYVIEDKERHRYRLENVGYYHDVENDAHMKVTRTEDGPIMTGTLSIDGRSYKLVPEPRHQGEEWTKGDTGQAYSLVTLDEAPSVLHRFRRQRHRTEIYIDIVAVADYSCYQYFLSMKGNRNNAIAAMNEYYAFVISAADLRYRSITSSPYNIHLCLKKLVVLETYQSSFFIENFKSGGSIHADLALNALKNYAKNDGNRVLYPSDHIMLFTSYNLADSTRGSSIHGTTYLGTVCQLSGNSISIVQDRFGYQVVSDIVAHELGHSFSANHDGQSNPCEAEDLYLMTPMLKVTDVRRGRSTHFSQCSINSFNDHFNQLRNTQSGRDCLLNKLQSSYEVPDVSNLLPGQKYKPDEQCKMVKIDYVWCRLSTNNDPDRGLCNYMSCGKMERGKLDCYVYAAAWGTSCGPGKMCINKECVSDSRAPQYFDSCTFGDIPIKVHNNWNCGDLVRNDERYCEQTFVQNWCCASCRTTPYSTLLTVHYATTVRPTTPRVIVYVYP